MPKYKIKMPAQLLSKPSIVIPISMGPDYHKGQKLEALIAPFECEFNATILIADSLYRFNSSAEEESKRLEESVHLGDVFMQENSIAISKAVFIHHKEQWLEEKDKNTLKLIRWETWKKIKSEELKLALDKMENDSKNDFPFFQSIQQTIEKSKTSKNNDKQSSIQYLQEECAVFLTFNNEFTYHLYPGKLNDAQAATYHFYKDTNEYSKLPSHLYIRFCHNQHKYSESHLEIARLGLFPLVSISEMKEWQQAMKKQPVSKNFSNKPW